MKNDGKYRDWDWIIKNSLAQGGYPGEHPGIFQAFDVVVYTAEEAQARNFKAPPGKAILRGPIDDDDYRPLPPQVGVAFDSLATQCARYAQQGGKILITCWQGRNRSGLLMALTLLKLYPSWTPQQAITLIKRNRKPIEGEPLSNTMFLQHILAQR